MAAPSSRYVCFGGFQLDTQRELLFKDGSKMRLPGKVFQTLVALLEKPGEVVTRESLRERLWPEGTFVNYDANVNTTVNKLRLALGDSSDSPAYIETIPRIGYCFVGQVERRTELQKSPAPTGNGHAPAGSATVPPANFNGASAATQASAKANLPLLIAQPGEDNRVAAPAKTESAATLADFWSAARNRGWAAVVLLCGVLIGMGIVLLTHRT
ncbi:MAG TPA: winged helix-turn-helix domain-containing protein [Candidatus Acidoferrum sp.]|nr:winged helix-turn-helix domain-containing protein [Candidatus Acidoferrum sp.]